MAVISGGLSTNGLLPVEARLGACSSYRLASTTSEKVVDPPLGRVGVPRSVSDVSDAALLDALGWLALAFRRRRRTQHTDKRTIKMKPTAPTPMAIAAAVPMLIAPNGVVMVLLPMLPVPALAFCPDVEAIMVIVGAATIKDVVKDSSPEETPGETPGRCVDVAKIRDIDDKEEEDSSGLGDGIAIAVAVEIGEAVTV